MPVPDKSSNRYYRSSGQSTTTIKSVTIPMHADDRRKKAIIEDVAWAEANGQEFVQYECF